VRRAKYSKADMNYLAFPRASRNFISRPTEFSNPIIEFPAVAERPVTTGGKFLHRRHAVCPELADIIAALAGIGVFEGARR
jgi:hypothetical protein